MDGEVVRGLLQQELGGFVTSFVLVAEHVDESGQRMVTVSADPDQALTTSLGLIQWGEAWFNRDLIQHFLDTDD